MSKKTYDEKELLALISEVETQFAEHLAKSEVVIEPISKKEQIQAQAEVVEKSEHGYDEEDHKEMDKMYKSMTKAEADIHYKSVKKETLRCTLSDKKTTPAPPKRGFKNNPSI